MSFWVWLVIVAVLFAIIIRAQFSRILSIFMVAPSGSKKRSKSKESFSSSLFVLVRDCLIATAVFVSHRKPLSNQHLKLRKNEDTNLKHINFRDMLLGVAVGDAFGAGFEMRPRDWIVKNIDYTRYVNDRVSNPAYAINYTIGLYTDDTEMTLGLIHALLSGEKISEEVLVKYWTKEYHRGKNWLGIIRQGHGGIKTYYLGISTIQQLQNNNRNVDFPGNAPPMRAIPIGLLPEEEIETVGIYNATSTHPHPKAVGSSLAIAWAVRHLLVLQGNPSEVIRYIISKITPLVPRHVDEHFLRDLRKVDELGDYHKIPLGPDGSFQWNWELLCGDKNGSLKADAMRTAFCVLYIIKHCSAEDGPMDMLKYSIGIGGDVDSAASIVLGIYGGWRGLNIEGETSRNSRMLPKWLIEPLEDVDYIQDIAAKLKLWYQKKNL